MQEEKLSGRDSLELIESMINRARNHFGENGHLYLLWGWTVLGCCVTQFLWLQWKPGAYGQVQYVWFACWLVALYQMYYISQQERRKRVRTYTEDVIKAAWLCFVAAGVVTSVILYRMGYFRAMYPMFLMLYGIPTIISGAAMQFRPLVLGGVACFLLSVTSTLLSFEGQLLCLGLAVILAWIIPGYLLRKRYKAS